MTNNYLATAVLQKKREIKLGELHDELLYDQHNLQPWLYNTSVSGTAARGRLVVYGAILCVSSLPSPDYIDL